MSSQFFGLSIAYSGLQASNLGLNTTANNIANVETEGYSKQVTSQQTLEALRTFEQYGCAGAGVQVIAVERLRDEFYDVKYWNNNSNVGEYNIKSYYMKQIENYFSDTDTIPGFTTIFNNMYDALNQFQNNAGDVTYAAQFIGSASSLTDYFASQYANMEKLQADVNSEIAIKVDEINSLASSIATLNKQINVLEVGGSAANELRDQRTLLIDQLSQIVDVEVIENPVLDPNNPDQYTGATYYTVQIAGGQTLVDTNIYNELVYVARESYEKVNQTDIDGLYDLYWTIPGSEFDTSTAQKFGTNSTLLGGELQALFEMRDGNNGENFTGTITGIDSQTTTSTDASGVVSTVTNQIVSIDVTAAYLTDITKLNLSDQGGIINLGNQLFYYDSWTMTTDGSGNTSYDFVLSAELNTQSIQQDKVGKEATIGESIDYKGIPYYMNQMNEWVRSYAEAFNKILTEDGYDAYGDLGKDFFVADDLVSSGQIYIETGATSVSMSDYTLYYLTAKNFAVSKAIEEDPNLFATQTEPSSDSESGESKNDILAELVDLKTNTDKMMFRGASASEFLQSVLTDITLAASTANLFYENYTNIAYTIDSQRLSISGVDSDEEAMNLVKYQNAYTLASTLIQTLSEMYDQLILRTGV